MNELLLPPDTPLMKEEGLWELCTDRAYQMMANRRDLDEDVYYDQIKYWTVKIYQANLHLQDTIS